MSVRPEPYCFVLSDTPTRKDVLVRTALERAKTFSSYDPPIAAYPSSGSDRCPPPGQGEDAPFQAIFPRRFSRRFFDACQNMAYTRMCAASRQSRLRRTTGRISFRIALSPYDEWRSYLHMDGTMRRRLSAATLLGLTLFALLGLPAAAQQPTSALAFSERSLQVDTYLQRGRPGDAAALGRGTGPL